MANENVAVQGMHERHVIRIANKNFTSPCYHVCRLCHMASNVETDEAREERLRRRRERDRIRRQTETPEQRDARFNIITLQL